MSPSDYKVHAVTVRFIDMHGHGMIRSFRGSTPHVVDSLSTAALPRLTNMDNLSSATPIVPGATRTWQRRHSSTLSEHGNRTWV